LGKAQRAQRLPVMLGTLRLAQPTISLFDINNPGVFRAATLG
jgi:hypothetical protein